VVPDGKTKKKSPKCHGQHLAFDIWGTFSWFSTLYHDEERKNRHPGWWNDYQVWYQDVGKNTTPEFVFRHWVVVVHEQKARVNGDSKPKGKISQKRATLLCTVSGFEITIAAEGLLQHSTCGGVEGHRKPVSLSSLQWGMDINLRLCSRSSMSGESEVKTTDNDLRRLVRSYARHSDKSGYREWMGRV
jgi:hypothetical protein